MNLQKMFTFIILAGALIAGFLRKDIFPFSHYPMYSMLIGPSTKTQGPDIRGVTEDGREVSLQAWRYMKPFWYLSLQNAVLVDPNPEKIQMKLKAALQFYNKNASKDQQTLSAMRLYQVKLNWDRIVSEVRMTKKFNRELGDEKELLYEVSQ